MKEYKKNEASRDIFYEEQKREKLKDSVTKQMQEEREVEKDALEKEDPWMKSKFSNASSTTTEAPVVEETTTTEQPLNEVNNTVEKTI